MEYELVNNCKFILFILVQIDEIKGLIQRNILIERWSHYC
jgi:hypothetical protein